ncbi:helix-turn-helix transcriptional regulator [Serratia ficaria]|uniref:helix-turn-helix transcriptional regulator n=1 Tax=Serratia ficaria TaxID=61651 RepID=UPI0012B735AC|nr:hypothetical protein [Serratia ficaria]
MKRRIDIFSDFTMQHPNVERMAIHDLSLVLFSKNAMKMLGVIENIVLANIYCNKKIKLLLVNPDEVAVRLLTIFGISAEIITRGKSIKEIVGKVESMLDDDDAGDIHITRRKQLTASEIDVFFGYLRGCSLQEMAKRRGTDVKTIYTQKNKAKNKLQVRSLSKFFLK